LESGYTFFRSGEPEGERRGAGVGFAIRPSLVTHLSDLPNGISERLISLRVPLKHDLFMTLISVYASTLTSAKEDIDKFYSDLKSAMQKVDHQDKRVVLGDFNAHIGKDTSGVV
jgi:exonuclease III